MRIFLIGFMGSGKSTNGKKLATLLDFDFLDLDQITENTYQVSIPQIFEKYDEKAFRLLEQASLKTTISKNNCVIATGGGTPCFFNNMDWMNNNGITIYFQMHPLSLHQRILEAKKIRPLIQNKTTEEILNYINKELEYRNKFYQQAKFVVKGENLQAKDIMNLLNI